jgi:hypothetical protein
MYFRRQSGRHSESRLYGTSESYLEMGGSAPRGLSIEAGAAQNAVTPLRAPRPV